MSFFDSKVSVFQITDVGAQLRDLSAYINEIRGLPGPRNLDEVTALGDSGAKFIPGIENVQVTISGIFDDTASSGPDAVLGPLRTHTAAVAFDYGPKGKTAGFPRYAGDCWVTSYEITSRVGNRVEWTATLQVNGTVSRGTY